MCNTSIYQQKRKFDELAKSRGLVFAKANQASPRKFEVILTDTGSAEIYMKREVYDFLLCDNGVRYKRVK